MNGTPFWICVGLIAMYAGVLGLAVALPQYRILFLLGSIFCIGAGLILVIFAHLKSK